MNAPTVRRFLALALLLAALLSAWATPTCATNCGRQR